jgi:hypothetical protein
MTIRRPGELTLTAPVYFLAAKAKPRRLAILCATGREGRPGAQGSDRSSARHDNGPGLSTQSESRRSLRAIATATSRD